MSTHRRRKKQDKTAKADAAANSFEALAEEFLDKNRREGKLEATMNKKRWLISLALKELQSKPLGETDATDILVSLRRVEALGNYETARRLRAVISQVFRYGIATARVSNDPTFGLRGAIIAPKVTHRAALTEWESFTGLIKSIWAYTGSIEKRTAMKLMALLYPRPRELRQAEWTEFDLDKATWTIPEERAKMRRVHRKPLPPVAVDILRKHQRHTGNLRLVFPSSTSLERPISEQHAEPGPAADGFRKTRSDLPRLSHDRIHAIERKRAMERRRDRGRACTCGRQRGPPRLPPRALLKGTRQNGRVVG
ncbi:MAG: hypothetical protein KI789_19830 [Hoeflea sp.]|nr:hypothetical protein [Hoeflea sp.]